MNNSTDQTEPNSPFHAGELMAQHRAGVRDRADANGRRGIRGHMPEQHRDFFGQLPFIVIGALDDAGHPCASLLMGAPGFMHAPDAQSLQVQALPDVGDPLCGALRVGCDVGLLGIELETRRRNRLNGSLTSMDQDGFRIAVSQSFGNCQKYIQCRTLAPRQQSAAPLQALSAHSLDESSVALIQAADTFFIATHASSPGRAGTGGADVSHRGGKSGFVLVEADNTLLWPDFAGNAFFNTIGNLQLNSEAGLLFPDFISGDLLHLTGRCEVIWEGAQINAFIGAERLVRFRVEHVRRRPRYLPWQSSEPTYSPFLAGTGNWISPMPFSG